MITYVTCDDVDNAFGNAWTSENAKNKAVLMANAWLNGFNLKINPSRIPEEVNLREHMQPELPHSVSCFSRKMILALLSVKPCRLTGSVYRNHLLSCQQTALHCLNPIYSLR